MISLSSRRAQIETRLAKHFVESTGVAISTPDADTWRALAAGLGPHAQFGWSVPIAGDDPELPGIIVPFCPEILDEQTSDLDDHALDEYLMVVEWVSDSHVLYWFDEPDPEERQRKIEAEMYEEYPASLNVWNDVVLAALDSAVA